ncbi:DUF6356 family protein [Caballeronia sp. dw_19]|jgi:Family of unknown function (DUF6356)|uniref:DUF6356 family protein n=1 Tax=Caballeronia sp. dw_19 TaxID=2719791 RepID=UPI001BD454D9|nr:DUF6356 family protein [Caballeronia sp. dw_19]
MKNIFTTHPAAVGETYFEHLRVAVGFGARLFVAGIACCIHALLPWLFVSTGSRAVVKLHKSMVLSRVRNEH